MGAESHCESQIASTAFWDLSQFLVDRHGISGWEIAEKLFFKSLPLVHHAYSINPAGNADGCGSDSWYNVLQNLDKQANGGLHECEIFRAFDAHGIACLNASLASSCPDWASAGPDREICVDQKAVLIGPDTTPGSPFSWNTGETSRQILVNPTAAGVSTYTLTTYPPGTKPSINNNINKTPSFSDEVQVRAYKCLGLFSEDFSAPPEGWQTSGLWHFIDTGACSNPTPGMYFGIDGVCNYETCHTTYGDLVSPPILVKDPTDPDEIPVMIFNGRRRVEYDPQPIASDTAEIWVQEWKQKWNTPGDSNDLRWAKNSALSGDQTEILETATFSLEKYIGSTIQLVFKFDTRDQYENDYLGWQINNVTVSTDSPPKSWSPPSNFYIVSPSVGQNLPCCKCATFEVWVQDYEGTDISDQVVWTLNGTTQIGSGRGMQTVLPPTKPGETHTITASVIDRMGHQEKKEFQVEVPNNGLECEILSMSPAEILRMCSRRHRGSGTE